MRPVRQRTTNRRIQIRTPLEKLDLVQRVFRLHKLGQNQRQISEVVGISKSYVQAILRAYDEEGERKEEGKEAC